jgi:hypothetical protein
MGILWILIVLKSEISAELIEIVQYLEHWLKPLIFIFRCMGKVRGSNLF